MKLTPQQLHILQHALGADKYGHGPQFRNYFMTGPSSKDFLDCQALTAAGLMRAGGASEECGGDHFFAVTDEGKRVMKERSPMPPKLTVAQQRYRRWLSSGAADCGVRFGSWLKLKHEKN